MCSVMSGYFRIAKEKEKMADKPKHNPPEGMEPYDLEGPGDLGALSQEQQEKLNRFKVCIPQYTRKKRLIGTRCVDWNQKH